jgi:hypothetical protein
MKKSRTEAVTVKMTQADLDRFLKCQAVNWPDIPLTRSSLILTLARLGCEQLEREYETKMKKPKG